MDNDLVSHLETHLDNNLKTNLERGPYPDCDVVRCFRQSTVQDNVIGASQRRMYIDVRDELNACHLVCECFPQRDVAVDLSMPVWPQLGAKALHTRCIACTQAEYWCQ